MHTQQLHQLFADYHEWHLDEFPDMALHMGDRRAADQLTDESLSAIERRHGDKQQFLDRCHAVNRDELTEADQLNYDLFEWQLKTDIASHEHLSFIPHVSGRTGPHQFVAGMHEHVQFEHEEDLVSYLARLEKTPTMMEQQIELLKMAIRKGITQPKFCVQTLPKQLSDLIDGGQFKELETPLKTMDNISADRRKALQDRFANISFPAAMKAMEAFQTFMLDEYIPSCRDTIAAIDRPNGEAFYNFELQHFTTTGLTASEIHEIGLKEVARIRAEMMEVIRKTDFYTQAGKDYSDDNALFSAFVEYLRTNPRFYHKSADTLVSEYCTICKRIDGELPRIFQTLPQTPYGVKEIPKFNAPGQTTAFYCGGSIKNGRSGTYYVNTYALDQRPRYEMTSLSLHEAVPGHHLQAALQQELENLPEFRKHLWFHAFGEGWALYAERLGIELGFYADPYDDFGRLLYEMWRATRLVVDPGMHALGWTRDKAVAFMQENTALSEHNINSEIDRYISWPGQATSYKIGEIKVRELRRRAEEKLGDQFCIRSFHDAMLLNGSIPLAVLEKHIDAWIDTQLQ